MDDELLKDLDDVFSAKVRLGIMTLLLAHGEQDFPSLKGQLGLTDGNLGAHIRVLEDARYIDVEKGFVGRRPRTLCRITDLGREAFAQHLRRLETIIRMVNDNTR